MTGQTSAKSVPYARQGLSLVSAGLFYIGLGAALPVQLDREVSLISPVLAVGLVLAGLGWRGRPWPPVPPRYFLLALAAVVWSLISAVYVWRFPSLYRSATLGLWLLFLVPGLGELLRAPSNRRALMAGLLGGALVYAVVAAVRLSSGESSLDPVAPGAIEQNILGLSRNPVNMRMVMVLPFALTARYLTFPRVLRWPVIGMLVMWIVTSGGRSGLVGLMLVALLYALLQPGLGRKGRTLVAVALFGLLALTVMHEAGGRAVESTNRLMRVISGERTGSDEARDLLVEKGLRIANEHPLVGIGAGNFRGYYHPVVQEASRPSVRRAAINANAHNTYVEMMASIGYPGALALFAALLYVLVAGLRRAQLADVRLSVCALAGILFVIYFHSSLDSLVFLSLAIVLATATDARPLVGKSLERDAYPTAFKRGVDRTA